MAHIHIFLVFDDLDSLKEYWLCILLNMLLGFARSFSHGLTRIVGFGEKDQKGEVHFSSHLIKNYRQDLTNDTGLGHLAEATLVQFLHHKATPPSIT